jgi:hypothetical protein
MPKSLWRACQDALLLALNSSLELMLFDLSPANDTVRTCFQPRKEEPPLEISVSLDFFSTRMLLSK